MFSHTPVLLQEVLAALDIREGGRYLDATFGRGGHSAAILERVGPQGAVLAFDRDPAAIAAGRERFANDGRMTLVSSAFSRLGTVVAQMGLTGAIDGVLLDLGVSSPQLDDASRGFSFMQDGPLDMRMDDSSGSTAAELVAKAPEHEIARIIRDFGEDRFAKRIARAIVSARREAPIVRTLQLAEIVAQSIPAREPGKHPATRTFQAIRIQVNHEFEEIRAGLAGSLAALAPRRAAVRHQFPFARRRHRQTFHAGAVAGRSRVRRLARRARARASETAPRRQGDSSWRAEVAANPRARSAVMRVAEKVAA